jgi:GNAT superfamily N-acetyltransferase
MFIDWSQPPKSLNDFWSGKYYENWQPRIAQALKFNRQGWTLKHANNGVSYVYNGVAEVDLDCDSNLSCRHHRLKHRVIIIRFIKVYPKHRRQGVMTKILEELIDQFPNSDLLAVLSPQEGDRDNGVSFMKKTYERLNFIEIDWERYLTFNEHYEFHQRCVKNGGFMPPAMVHVGGGDEDALRLWKEIEGVSVLPKLDSSSHGLSQNNHPKVRATPDEMGLRLKNTAHYF